MQTITYITFNFPLEDFFQLSTLNSQLYPVIRAGFEPATHSLEGCCSIQLSYRTPKKAYKITAFFWNMQILTHFFTKLHQKVALNPVFGKHRRDD